MDKVLIGKIISTIIERIEELQSEFDQVKTIWASHSAHNIEERHTNYNPALEDFRKTQEDNLAKEYKDLDLQISILRKDLKHYENLLRNQMEIC